VKPEKRLPVARLSRGRRGWIAEGLCVSTNKPFNCPSCKRLIIRGDSCKKCREKRPKEA
jgi:hypothetical protein